MRQRNDPKSERVCSMWVGNALTNLVPESYAWELWAEIERLRTYYIAANMTNKELEQDSARLSAALREIQIVGHPSDLSPKQLHAIIAASAEIARRALGGPSGAPLAECEHDYREYSINNAASPLDPPDLYKWTKCIKCGLQSAAMKTAGAP